jgi:thioredoxin-dependent peroxiredoxin
MLTIGQPAPDFALPNQDGQIVRLSDLRGHKVALFSFPKSDSPVCTQQACYFRDDLPRFQAENIIVLGVGADSVAEMLHFKQKRKLNYDLLADTEHTMLDAWGAWGIDLLGLIKFPIVQRSYWVVNEHGILIDQQINIGAKDSMTRALKAAVASTTPA